MICNDLACRCSPVPLFTLIGGHGPRSAGREIQWAIQWGYRKVIILIYLSLNSIVSLIVSLGQLPLFPLINVCVCVCKLPRRSGTSARGGNKKRDNVFSCPLQRTHGYQLIPSATHISNTTTGLQSNTARRCACRQLGKWKRDSWSRFLVEGTFRLAHWNVFVVLRVCCVEVDVAGWLRVGRGHVFVKSRFLFPSRVACMQNAHACSSMHAWYACMH